nr:type VI secretion system-associated protein TagF [uncultured Cohaesibacter sp.]
MSEFVVMNRESAFGWYGKVPFVGDFVRSGLSPGFVQAWDHWLQGLMITGQEALQDQWVSCYMSAPIWRFALSSGICGSHAVAGIVMPSVDRVGRPFPLCLAMEAEDPAWVIYKSLAPVFPALEAAALAMLEEEATLDLLRRALHQVSADNLIWSDLASGTQKSNLPLLFKGREEEALDGLKQHEQATLWISSHDEENRILLTPQMPGGSEMAKVIFNLNAPIWGTPSPTGKP